MVHPQELNMTLRLTLPQKYVNGPSKDACMPRSEVCRHIPLFDQDVIRLFVEHYNKKHAESPLDVDDLHVKVTTRLMTRTVPTLSCPHLIPSLVQCSCYHHPAWSFCPQ
eukprot:5774073-Amphidinium_carterae.2